MIDAPMIEALAGETAAAATPMVFWTRELG
jgi:hypothetical protein